MRSSSGATPTAIACLVWSTAIAPQTPVPRAPPSALDFMVEAVRAFCLSHVDPIEAAHRLLPAGWRLTDRADHYDREYGIDAPLPLHDTHERGWRGVLADGRAQLIVRATNYRDPARQDHSSAMFMASPETAIDLDAFQRRIGMTLRPTGPAHAGRPTSYRVLVINGRPGPTIPARYGQMQHFTLGPEPAGMEISATRAWGDGFPEQWLRVSCRTRFREADPGDTAR